jgi:cell division protein FtsI (penicillin-binding protein 3)
VKRQVPLDVADKIAALDIPASISATSTSASIRKARSPPICRLHERRGRRAGGRRAGDQKSLSGTSGVRRVIKDRLGRIVEDVAEQIPPHDGTDVDLSIDSKIQYIAYANLKAAVEKFKAKAGAAMVVDVRTGEVLALVNYPTYNPNDRTRLTGEQLRNRILTDVFEPGSIMKPFTVSLALDLHRVTPNTLVETGNGHCARRRADHRRCGLRHADGRRRDPEVEQHRRDQDRDDDAARGNVEHVTSIGLGQAPKVGFPAPWPAGCARGRAGAASSRRRCRTATGCRCRCSSWRARTPRSRTTAN